MNNLKYKDYCNAVLDFLENIKYFLEDNGYNSFLDEYYIEFKKIINCINEFLNSKKSIYLIGPSSSGKSTFINHIVGKLILPQSAKVETRVISQVNDSKENYIRIILKDKIDNLNINELLKSLLTNKYLENEQTLKFDITIENDLKNYTQLVKSNNEKNNRNDASSFIKEVIINYPFRYFKNFIFYDTPGIDSAKGDTDDEIIKELLLKSSSYVFFFFNSKEYCQSELKTQINKYKDIFLKITNKRLIFIGTHYDLLKRNIKDENAKNKNNELSINGYLKNLREYLKSQGIEFLDIFLINLNPRIKDYSEFPPLDKEDEVCIGEMIHKLNMHYYELYNYFLDILVNSPKTFIEENIIPFLNEKISFYKNEKLKTEEELKKETENYSKRKFIIENAKRKYYFKEFFQDLKEKNDEIINAEKRNFDEKIDELEKFINNSKKYIKSKIEEDPGGEGCDFNSIKYKLLEEVDKFSIDEIDLKSYHKKFNLPWRRGLKSYHKKFNLPWSSGLLMFNKFIILMSYLKKYCQPWCLSEGKLKEPFQKGNEPDEIKEFRRSLGKLKYCLDGIIHKHYNLIQNKNDNNFNIKKHQINEEIKKYEDKIKSVNTFKEIIITRISELLNNFEKIRSEEFKKKDISENIFIKFLNDYKIYKLNNIYYDNFK